MTNEIHLLTVAINHQTDVIYNVLWWIAFWLVIIIGSRVDTNTHLVTIAKCIRNKE